MTIKFQVTFDCAAPAALARFWTAALGYELEEPPEAHDTWEAFLESIGVPEDEWDMGASAVDPEGIQPRLYFQQVPESKTTKNRLHLDVDVSQGWELHSSNAGAKWTMRLPGSRVSERRSCSR